MNTATLTPTAAHAATILPAIGAAFSGGIFAGITLHEDRPHALVLLAGDDGDMEWPDALEFAAKRDGVLPSRIDMIVLYKNLRDQFKKDWYWTAEEHPVHADSAFVQDFGSGGQHDDHKDGDCRARAVRRVAL